MQRTFLYVLGCCLIMLLPLQAFSSSESIETTFKSPSVIFLVPGKKRTGFFTPVTKIMAITAKNLGIKIESVDTDISPIVMKELATKHLLKEYPNTSVIWSSSDLMVPGAVEGVLKNRRYAGKDIYICGIDWAAAFEKLADETLSCTVGGHVFDGACFLVLLQGPFNQLTTKFPNAYTGFSVVDSKN